MVGNGRITIELASLTALVNAIDAEISRWYKAENKAADDLHNYTKQGLMDAQVGLEARAKRDHARKEIARLEEERGPYCERMKGILQSSKNNMPPPA